MIADVARFLQAAAQVHDRSSGKAQRSLVLLCVQELEGAFQSTRSDDPASIFLCHFPGFPKVCQHDQSGLPRSGLGSTAHELADVLEAARSGSHDRAELRCRHVVVVR